VCLAVPGQICALHDDDGVRLATVDFGGVRKRICVETVPDIALGAWVLVHAGIALQQIDADAAAESLRLLAEATSQIGDTR
jgi:hydrogenase expression/formation protein HypC